MRKRLLFDLFCCAGCASDGYVQAGFDVVGVDKNLQPNYPYEFIKADALDLLEDLLLGVELCGAWSLADIAAFHASPPCQHFTKYGNAVKDLKERYEDLLEPTRELLRETGKPYVIENVEDAPLIDPVMLCGSMFEIDVQRHRLFETNWPLEAPWMPCRHKLWGPGRFKSSTGRRPNSRKTCEIGSFDEPLEVQLAAMGMPTDRRINAWPELSQGVPPAYTEFIGRQLLAHIESEVRDELAA